MAALTCTCGHSATDHRAVVPTECCWPGCACESFYMRQGTCGSRLTRSNPTADGLGQIVFETKCVLDQGHENDHVNGGEEWSDKTGPRCKSQRIQQMSAIFNKERLLRCVKPESLDLHGPLHRNGDISWSADGDISYISDGRVAPDHFDPVDRPAHYASGRIEVIDFIEDKGLGFCLGNTVKYVARAGKKDPTKTVEDLKKARWHLNREIERLEKLEKGNG